ncbi:ShlB/FhaC/HecB family hemolysin secretion/activation protein [Flavisphingomonas formosensis]|uniref:ShlB/FhaC/HecB family hemolysin secretion/activation protein n=1 Tax=Flavisphingomonas formosensis TaxID=861534 RepID=UPI0018DF6B7A|nr:ShlB/FhaC/HecB family hemolysin secretion/activation protein [Sphingomonas formosensis]
MNCWHKAGRYSGLILALLAGAARPALGQQLSTGVSAPTREEIQRAPAQDGQPAPSRLTVEGEVERAPCPLADPKFQSVTFTLQNVVFDDLRGLTAAQLASSWQDLRGKTIPIASVCEIRDAAATILRRAGYLAAVQVPPQKIGDGTVHLQVLMAKIVAVQVRGNAGRSERLIAGYLEALKKEEVFNQREAERYLLLARDLPGYDVRLVLRPAGTVPGEVIAEVSIRKTPVAIEANIQNYGSREVGRFGGMIRGEVYGLLGMGDRASASLFSTADFEEQQVLQLGYDFRVGRQGLTIGGNYTQAWTHPGIAGNFPIRSNTRVYNLEASYPFVRRQDLNLRGAVGLDVIDQDVRFGGAALNRDRLRMLYARLDFDATDATSLAGGPRFNAIEPRWRIGGSVEIRKGIDIFNASKPCSRPSSLICSLILPTLTHPDGDPRATVFRADARFEYRPMRGIAFFLSPRGQYSADPLLSYEEYSVGNYTVGRGYDPGTLLGDSGVGFQSEIRLGSIVPKSGKDLAIQPFAFFDAAWVWNQDKGFYRPYAERDPQHLYSAGGGARVAWGDRARFDATVAVPLSHPPAFLAGVQRPKGDVRFLISLTTRLWPWAY